MLSCFEDEENKKHEDGLVMQQSVDRRTAYEEYNEENEDDHDTDGHDDDEGDNDDAKRLSI